QRLLAEAGYPSGFSVTLDCPNDRYINDAAVCRAVGAMLGDVGIIVTVDAHPMRDHVPKILTRQTDFYLLGWLGTAFDSYSHLVYLVHRGGTVNATGYANPDLDTMIERIGTELATYLRDALIEQAWQRVGEDIVYGPLYYPQAIW